MVSNLNIYKNSYNENVVKFFAQLQRYLIKSLSLIWKQSANWEGWGMRSGQEGGPTSKAKHGSGPIVAYEISALVRPGVIWQQTPSIGALPGLLAW